MARSSPTERHSPAGRDAKQRLGGRVRLVAGGFAGEHGRQLGAALVRPELTGLGDGSPVDGALADDDVDVGVCRDLCEVVIGHHLVMRAQRPQPLTDRGRIPPPTPASTSSSDEQGRLVGGREHDLQREQAYRPHHQTRPGPAASAARRGSART